MTSAAEIERKLTIQAIPVDEKSECDDERFTRTAEAYFGNVQVAK